MTEERMKELEFCGKLLAVVLGIIAYMLYCIGIMDFEFAILIILLMILVGVLR